MSEARWLAALIASGPGGTVDETTPQPTTPAISTDRTRYLSFDINDSPAQPNRRSEEHTSELQSLMRISYAVFCLKKKKQHITNKTQHRDLLRVKQHEKHTSTTT